LRMAFGLGAVVVVVLVVVAVVLVVVVGGGGGTVVGGAVTAGTAVVAVVVVVPCAEVTVVDGAGGVVVAVGAVRSRVSPATSALIGSSPGSQAARGHTTRAASTPINNCTCHEDKLRRLPGTKSANRSHTERRSDNGGRSASSASCTDLAVLADVPSRVRCLVGSSPSGCGPITQPPR
jgi:hypothetical protein